MGANWEIAEEEFIEAKKNWDLDKLYIELASYKGKALTPVEKKDDAQLAPLDGWGNIKGNKKCKSDAKGASKHAGKGNQKMQKR